MAQPQPAGTAQELVSTNAIRATRVTQMLGMFARSATRTPAEHADGGLAMVGVLVPVVILNRTNACALLGLVLSMENAERPLIVPKPQTFHASLVSATLVNVMVVRHFDTAHAV